VCYDSSSCPTTARAWANESLLTDPIVYTLGEDALSRYERRVLVR
jgi:hypothetical protein